VAHESPCPACHVAQSDLHYGGEGKGHTLIGGADVQIRDLGSTFRCWFVCAG
jgi:hypothetical protein